MSAKIALIFVVAFVVFQMLTWETDATAIKIKRDVAATNASQAIDDALNQFKTGLEDLMKKIQDNDVVQNISKSLQQFGETVQQKSKQLVEDLNKKASE